MIRIVRRKGFGGEKEIKIEGFRGLCIREIRDKKGYRSERERGERVFSVEGR